MARYAAREVFTLWKILTPLSYNISEEFLHNELTPAFNLLKPGKSVWYLNSKEAKHSIPPAGSTLKIAV